jgi:acyl-CoA synthetase (AMP-forming)/AMP-acid ligase II
MNDVPVGEVGEIVYRATTLMSGYWINAEATAEAFSGGWFRTAHACGQLRQALWKAPDLGLAMRRGAQYSTK